MLDTRTTGPEILTEQPIAGCRALTGTGLGRLAWIHRKPVQISIIAAAPIITIASFALVPFIDELQSANYVGLFLISLISSATLFLPTSGGAAVLVAAVVLNPVLVGLVSGIGSGLGEITGYALGYAGQAKLQQGRLYQRLHRHMRRRAGLIIFLVAVTPNPFMDLAGIAAGTICYPVRRFLLLTITGKIIKTTGLALAASLGWDAIIG